MEPKHLNDPDPWMLAEDIPDMDPFFSQIPWSCFVNEFAQQTGKAYKKLLSIQQGYHLWFYFGEKDSFDVGENIVQKFLKNPGFATKVNQEIVRWSDLLRAYCDKLPTTGLDKLSKQRLWELYEGQDKVHTEYYTWGWIPVASDMFHNNLTEKLKAYLKSKGIPEDKLNEYFVILTQPTQKSPIQLERDEFLRLAALINKDESQSKLFYDIYKAFQERVAAKFGFKTHTPEYETRLEAHAADLKAQIKPEILDKVKKHHAKYGYVNHMWVGKASTLEYYLKELVKLIGVSADAEQTLRIEEEEFHKAVNKRAELVKQLNLDDNYRVLFDAFSDFMVTKIYRRFAQIYAVYRMEPILEEIGKRLGLTLMQTRFLAVDEIKAALLEGKVDKAEIDERIKFSVWYYEQGVLVVYTGDKAKEIAEKAKQVKVMDVSELKGQAGCIGHAKGVVKIIIRPADMAKMNQGDILVSIATDPDVVPAMKKAAAIVTEQGGVTSHAAIVSRELRIPCVIGTKIATRVLKDGDIVEVDANKGIVKIIKRAK